MKSVFEWYPPPPPPGLSLAVRELKQPRRLRRGRRQVKSEFISYGRNLSRSVRYTIGSKNVLELTVQWPRVIPNGNEKLAVVFHVP